MTHSIRRIVTGHDQQGKAEVLSDASVAIAPVEGGGFDGAVVWSTSVVPADNSGPVSTAVQDVGPTLKGGSVFWITEFGPGFTSPMHRTLSLDYCCLISGRLEMVMDGGVVVTLTPGDTVVQRGTSHVWRNPSSDTPARILVCMIESLPIFIDGQELQPNA